MAVDVKSKLEFRIVMVAVFTNACIVSLLSIRRRVVVTACITRNYYDHFSYAIIQKTLQILLSTSGWSACVFKKQSFVSIIYHVDYVPALATLEATLELYQRPRLLLTLRCVEL